MISPVSIPGLFITGTDTGVGKTVIAAAVASILRQQGFRVGVCKPVASGCVRRREGLVCEDAEFLAHHSNSLHPLHLICPQRYAEPLAPAVAAQRAGQPLDWLAVDRSLRLMSADSDVMIVEGVGGAMVPLDEKYLVTDLAKALRLPAVIVARATLGTINHTLMTVEVLRAAGVRLAGVVINQYPPDLPGVAEETNPRQIEKSAKVPILAIVPECKSPLMPVLPIDLTSPLQRVNWAQYLSKE